MNRSNMGKQVSTPGMKKPKGYAPGGSVPKDMKGFSKLPEGVQQKMNPAMAEKYSGGGLIKGKLLLSTLRIAGSSTELNIFCSACCVNRAC